MRLLDDVRLIESVILTPPTGRRRDMGDNAMLPHESVISVYL